MDYSYVFTPFLTWSVAGVTKFIINSCKARQLAWGLVGYGGLPSNHSAIVTSIAALIAMKEGFDSPVFGVAVTLAFVVMLDANSLRRQIGKQAATINRLAGPLADGTALRERMGHTRIEIAAGIIVGIAVAYAVFRSEPPRV